MKRVASWEGRCRQYLSREVVENVADSGGRTHIGEEGPPHQGEETRHFEIFAELSTTSKESVRGCVSNNRKEAPGCAKV